MPTTHQVRQGECLSSIAARYGFADWKAIYEHADNAELRKKRPNPNVIHPGDRVTIPDRELKEVGCATGAVHRFVVKAQPTRLKIRFRDAEGKGYADRKYQLVVGARTLEGRTDGDGLVDQPVPAHEARGELTVWLHGEDTDGYKLSLDLGALDPPEEISGAQARLVNLGFDGVEVSGALDDGTREALRAFQEKHGLTVSGALDEATIAELRKQHEE